MNAFEKKIFNKERKPNDQQMNVGIIMVFNLILDFI